MSLKGGTARGQGAKNRPRPCSTALYKGKFCLVPKSALEITENSTFLISESVLKIFDYNYIELVWVKRQSLLFLQNNSLSHTYILVPFVVKDAA